jgi:hypothetical protein
VTADQRRGFRSPGRRPSPPDRLPVRWAVILSLSYGVGLVVGAAEGLAAGVLAFIAALGALQAIVG